MDLDSWVQTLFISPKTPAHCSPGCLNLPAPESSCQKVICFSLCPLSTDHFTTKRIAYQSSSKFHMYVGRSLSRRLSTSHFFLFLSSFSPIWLLFPHHDKYLSVCTKMLFSIFHRLLMMCDVFKIGTNINTYYFKIHSPASCK